jgi:ribonuclease R
MIEEFMLSANEAVASSFRDRGEPAVWRIHDAPDPGRLEQFAALAAHYGVAIDVDAARTPRGLRGVLEKLRGHPAEKPLSFALLRSLKQATYDVVNVGHFGLASRDYLHFTSPIRRYPDLIVHRLLKVRLAGLGRPSGGWKSSTVEPPPDRAELQRLASDASFAERSKMEAEREVVDIYRAYFMRDRIGDVFDGTISGVMGFGVFVVIDQPFIEGLVRVEALSDDYYLFDEVTARLVGRRSGRTFALGDTVKVEVQSVSVVRRKIDFALHEHGERQRRSAAAGASTASRRAAADRAAGGRRTAAHRGSDHGGAQDRHAPAVPGRVGKRPGKASGGAAGHAKGRGRSTRKRR